MSDVSSTLNRLIDVAERTLCCRQHIRPEGFEDFSREVAALQSPIGVVLSQAPRNLIAVLGCLWESPDAQRPLWLMTIAALLQLVRADLSQVIEARRRPLEPDSGQICGDVKVSEKSARQIIADVLKPGPIGEFAEAPLTVACDIDEHLEQSGFAIVKAVPVAEWEIIVDELVLIYVVHFNAQFEKDEKRRREEWEGWHVGKWINFNKGGWTWHGLCGQVTHVAPLPERPQ